MTEWLGLTKILEDYGDKALFLKSTKHYFTSSWHMLDKEKVCSFFETLFLTLQI